MNVLLYAGPGTSPKSVDQTKETLSELMTPYASITLVTDAQLFAKQPWQQSTILLVVPGGRDIPYCRSLRGTPIEAIDRWVRLGGKYMGLCAGGYFASSRLEFLENDPKMAVVGPRDLKFYPGTARGTAFDGFVYDSEKGAKIANLAVETENMLALGVTSLIPLTVPIYYNGGGLFADADEFKDKGVTVLARYADPVVVAGGNAAIIHSKVGNGAAVLTGVHPEYVSPFRSIY
jgi:biotin--protein ligase